MSFITTVFFSETIAILYELSELTVNNIIKKITYYFWKINF